MAGSSASRKAILTLVALTMIALTMVLLTTKLLTMEGYYYGILTMIALTMVLLTTKLPRLLGERRAGGMLYLPWLYQFSAYLLPPFNGYFVSNAPATCLGMLYLL